MVDIEELRHTNNWFNYQDYYKSVATRPDFKIYVEVGVWKGHSVSFLANELRNKKDVKIYAVDLFDNIVWEPYQAEVNLLPEIYLANLIATNTRHLIEDIKDWSDKAAVKFADGAIDFVFIDADHAYEAVKKDIAAWLPKVRKGGIISGHDYHGGGGVIPAVDEAFGDDKTLEIGTVWQHIVR